MKTRWKTLMAVGIFLALLAGSLLLTVRVQPESALEAYKKSLREKGEKLEISEVLPPPIPPESNSVDAVEAAFRMFSSSSEKIPEAMKMVAPGKAMIGWRQPEARGFEFTNSWEEFTGEIVADGPTIELLQQVLERPRLDFQLDYKQGYKLLLPHLAPMKHATQKLDAAAICELHNGDTGAAATNILTMLALVQRNTSEGLLISHLVRIAMTSIAITPTWELLQATNVADAQLAAVQQGWEQMNFLSDAQYVFAMERAWTTDLIHKSRASHEGFEETFSLGSGMGGSGSSSAPVWTWPPNWDAITEGPRNVTGEVMWRSSWSYSGELRTLKCNQIMLETVRAMQTNRSQFYKADYDTMMKRLSSLGLTNAGAAFFHALRIPDYRDFFGAASLAVSLRRAIQIEAANHVVVTAIALKRFQLLHGQWPENLGELVPQFLSAVPIDPLDGNPLRYRPNVDGTFLLYSVGEDGKDDGGDPTSTATGTPNFSWQNNHARDWVWPQPATDAEIKYFYEHPPK